MLIGAGVLSAIVYIGTSGLGQSGPRDSPMSYSDARGREVYRFESLPVMVATSDLVVVGTVQSVRTGRVVGEADSPLEFMEVTVRIDETLFGDAPRSVILEVEEVLIGSIYEREPIWRAPGHQSMFFLHRKSDETPIQYYRPINSQGVLTIDQATGALIPAVADSFTSTLATLTVAELRQQILAAVEMVELGQVAPQPPLKNPAP